MKISEFEAEFTGMRTMIRSLEGTSDPWPVRRNPPRFVWYVDTEKEDVLLTRTETKTK